MIYNIVIQRFSCDVQILMRSLQSCSPLNCCVSFTLLSLQQHQQTLLNQLREVTGTTDVQLLQQALQVHGETLQMYNSIHRSLVRPSVSFATPVPISGQHRV